jgi:hypothetical protein
LSPSNGHHFTVTKLGFSRTSSSTWPLSSRSFRMNAFPYSRMWTATVAQNRPAGVYEFGRSCNSRHARADRASDFSPSPASGTP